MEKKRELTEREMKNVDKLTIDYVKERVCYPADKALMSHIAIYDSNYIIDSLVQLNGAGAYAYSVVVFESHITICHSQSLAITNVYKSIIK